MLLIGAGSAAAQARQVAITIDDLPRGGDGGPYDLAGLREMTTQLLRPFRDQKIPVIGFVNAGRRNVDPDGLRQLLALWLDAGAELGNHSYSHPDINNVALDTYTADIVKGEPAIRAALSARGKKLEFYRHPFLHLGATPEVKKDLQAFLDQRGYRVAPVTLDNADYAFAAAYRQPALRERARREYVPYMQSVIEFFERRSVEVVGREIPQVLLIHANQLNADLLPELLEMLRYYHEDRHFVRHDVTPGLTGWWQITSRTVRQTEVDPKDDLETKTRDDSYYVANRSLWLDLKILLRTPLMVVLRRGAF